MSIGPSGDLRLSDSISEKVKNFIYSSPAIKIALLNDLIGYENPNHFRNQISENQAKASINDLSGYRINSSTPEVQEAIRENKKKYFEQVIERELPNDRRAYTIFETPEERMLRL